MWGHSRGAPPPRCQRRRRLSQGQGLYRQDWGRNSGMALAVVSGKEEGSRDESLWGPMTWVLLRHVHGGT